MPRAKKVPLERGKKRLIFKKSGIEIEQTLFCGECKKRTQSATIRRNPVYAKINGTSALEEVARVCANVAGHKDSKKHFWPVKDVIIPAY